MPTKHLLIKGKVQNVFYRATAREMAVKLGLTGWIKNTDEGHVEAEVSGADAPVKQFIQWCWQGPADASVTAVEVDDITDADYTGFTIIRE